MPQAQRLYHADITYLKYDLSWYEKKCNSKMIATAFADDLYKAVDLVLNPLLIEQRYFS